MPATKKKKAPKARKARKTKKTAAMGSRWANARCNATCRIRTKGMKVGDTRRRISGDGKKLKITRVA